MARAAGDFFLESLSSFEMVQRGFREATGGGPARTSPDGDVASAVDLPGGRLARPRRFRIARGDAAAGGRAGTGARGRRSAASRRWRRMASRAAPKPPPFAEADRRWAGFVRWLDLFAIYRFIRMSGGSVRLAGEQLLEQPQFGSAAGQRPVQGWLAASLTALDGSELGAIQLFDKQDGALHRRRRGRPRPSGPDGLGRGRENSAVPRKRIANGPSVGHTREQPQLTLSVLRALDLDAPSSPDRAAQISAEERSRAPRRLRLCVRARVPR